MTCLRVNTDVLLANIFSIHHHPLYVKDIQEYLNYLSEMFPTYISSDFCIEKIQATIKQYPELYKISEDDNGDKIISPNTLKPNLKFFNQVYSDVVSSYLERATKSYFEKTYKGEIVWSSK